MPTQKKTDVPLTGERIHLRGTSSLTIQGKLVTFLKHKVQFPPENPGKRQSINGFSRPARLRLLKLVATIDWRRIGACRFITLTYPDALCTRDNKARTSDRSQFIRHIEKYLAYKPPILWRYEWKERLTGERTGWIVPHLHLLVLADRFIPKEEVRIWWRSIINAEGPLATDVRAVKEGGKAGVYIAKYFAKACEGATLDYASYLNNSGRHYGTTRKSKIPLLPVETIPVLPKAVEDDLLAYASDFLPWVDPSDPASFSVLGERCEGVLEIIRRFGLTFVHQIS